MSSRVTEVAGPLVLDAGALIEIESRPRGDTAARCGSAMRAGRPPMLAVVFAQVWRGSARQHALARLRRSCLSVAFTEEVAHGVGRLLARSDTSDVVDAAVVLLAVSHGGLVLTSHPGDLERLASAAGLPLRLIAV